MQDASTIKDRTTALDRVRHLLTTDKEDVALFLVDHTFLDLFQVLFQLVTNERATWISASKNTTKATSASRLTSYSQLIRFAVGIAIENMQGKTSRTIISHIVVNVTVRSGEWCWPLASDYVKVFLQILTYAPHLEHLSREVWLKSVDFCLESIRSYDLNPTNQHGSGWSSSVDRQQSHHSLNGTTLDSSSFGPVVKIATLMECLALLLVKCNTQIPDRVTNAVDCVVRYLLKRTSSTQANRAAFEVLSSCLDHMPTTLDTANLVSIPDILRCIKQFWLYSKDYNFRGYMLAVLLKLLPCLQGVLRTPPVDSLLAEVENLYEALLGDYCKERPGGHLRLREISLDPWSAPPRAQFPLQTESFWLRLVSSDTETHWTQIYVVLFFASWIDEQNSFNLLQTLDMQDDVDSNPKRQKTETRLESLMRLTKHSDIERQWVLQILSFVDRQHILSSTQLQDLLDEAFRLTAHDNAEVASWAFMVIAS